jgi:ubiquinone/menaquinone biosynthesis C-methylase UbiE
VEIRKLVEETYDIIAAEYAKRHFAEITFNEQREMFLKMLAPGSLILDAGCGPGQDAVFFTERGYRVIGIDISEGMLGIARERVPKAEFRRADILATGFPDKTFDGIWALRSLIHVEKKDVLRVLNELKRILRPGGLLFVGVLAGKGERIVPEPYDPTGKSKMFFNMFNKAEVEHLIKAANFGLIRSEVKTKPVPELGQECYIFVLARKSS